MVIIIPNIYWVLTMMQILCQVLYMHQFILSFQTPNEVGIVTNSILKMRESKQKVIKSLYQGPIPSRLKI